MKTLTVILLLGAIMLVSCPGSIAAAEPIRPAPLALQTPASPPPAPTPPARPTVPTPPPAQPGGTPPPPVPNWAPVAPAPGGASGFGVGGAPAPAAVGFRDRLQTIIGRAGGGSAGGPLLILSDEMDPRAQAQLEEDMSVMAHLLQKALGEVTGGSPGRAMGVELLFVPSGDARRDLYVQGHGVIFMLKVPFPLLGGTGSDDAAEKEGKAESEWEQARRELLGQPVQPELAGRPLEPYREETVNRLKLVLLESLRNANNIRELKPDDSITVCVLGPAEGRPGVAVRYLRSGSSDASSAPRLIASGTNPDNSTVLALSVSKADVEGFAKGRIDLEGLRKKAKITAYSSRAGEGTGNFGAMGFGGGMGGFGTGAGPN